MFVLYASLFGHTAALGEAIAKGASEVSGAQVQFMSVDDVEIDQLPTADAIVWGSSTCLGVPNVKMTTFLSKLGRLWATGALQGKIGGAFATSASAHGGIENVLRALQAPMMHNGMIYVSNTGELTEERTNFSCLYGACAVIPVESSKDAPMNKPNDSELKFAAEYGALVARTALRLEYKVELAL